MTIDYDDFSKKNVKFRFQKYDDRKKKQKNINCIFGSDDDYDDKKI